MTNRWTRLKPAASTRVQLALAAGTWSVVGAALLATGMRWCLEDGPAGPESPTLLAIGVAAGLVKAGLVFRRASRRVVERIRARGESRCMGGFFSWRTWIFVAGMAVAGRLVRSAGVPLALIGVVYVAVGVALLVGSWWLWNAWAACRRAVSP